MMFAILTSIGLAQPPDTTSTRSWVRGNDDTIYCVNPTGDGCLILTGVTRSDAYGDIWVAKTDANCDIEWERLIGGYLTDSGDFIEQTSDGGYILCGETWSWSGDISFGMYLAKLNPDGTLDWVQVRSDSGYNDVAICVREIADGDFIVTGEFSGRPHLWRVGPSGEERWLETYYFEDTGERIYYVCQTSDGGFVIAGQLIDDLGHNMALIKTDSAGELLWVNRYPDVYAENFSKAYCVEESRDGGLLVSGYFSDYQPNYADWILLKTDETGELLWETRISDVYTQGGHQLVETLDGGIVICGRYDSTEIVRSHIVKTDSLGNILWQNTLDGGESWSMCQMRDGSFAAAGPKNGIGVGPSEAMYLIKWEPDVEVELTPETTLFPSTGGTLVFDELMTNILITPTDIERWTLVLGSDDFYQAYPPITVTLQPGANVTNEDEQLIIPAGWPDGVYTVELHYGHHPDQMANMGLGTTQIQKGEVGVDDPDEVFTHQIPSEPMLSVYPNPFNATTTLTVFLPHPSEVTATVFNALGQQVGTLADGHFSAGTHTFTFDGSNLSSGLYFVHATVSGRVDLIQKVMLIR